MRSGRSLRACQLCRQRRVKCDKTLPTCIRCANFGQPCPGYPLFKTFIDQGSKARARVARRTAQTSTPQEDAFDTETPSINIDESPLTVSSHDFSTISSSTHVATPQATLSSVDDTLQDIDLPNELPINQDLQFFDLDIESYYADGNNACGFFADLENIEAQNFQADDSEAARIASGVNIAQDMANIQNHPQTQESEDDGEIQHDSETSILTRLYVEMLAPWMDLFDTSAYFTRIVPRNSAFDTLLRLALKAVAAKQTACYAISHSHSRYSKLLDLILAEHPGDSADQWFYRAASYYDQGISRLRSRFQGLIDRYGSPNSRSVAGTVFSQVMPSTTPDTFSAGSIMQEKALTREQNVLSAVSMFSFYETLDEYSSLPSQHLIGFLALAESLDARMSSPQSDTQLLFASQSAGRAAFWYFVRKDLLTSYAHGLKPAFDPEYRQFWIAAGLPREVFSIRQNGERTPGFQDLLGSDIAEDSRIMTYIIIWLSLTVINMIWNYRKNPFLDHENSFPLSSVTTPQTLAEETNVVRVSEWTRVRAQLSWWLESRPQIFHAYASCTRNSAALEGRKTNKTSFFTCSTGAAAMQLYHFVQILLLLNQPSGISHGSNQATKLRMLKRNNEEIESHSQEICAAALEMPAFAVQRQMSHPLRLASVYLDSPEDQDIILKTLATVINEACSPTEDEVQATIR